MKLPRVKAGDPITADLFNRLLEVAESCRLSVGQGGSLSLLAGPDGYTLSALVSRPAWAKTTGVLADGTYPFTLQHEGPSGTWIDAPLTGVAYEISGNTSVPIGTYVRLWWSSAGDWRFLAGSC